MDSKSKGKRVGRKESDDEQPSRPWQTVKPKRGKQRKKHKVETTPDPRKVQLGDSEALVKPKKKRKKQNKESDQDDMSVLHKKIDEIGNSLNELTEIVKKLHKKSDVPDISASKEKETEEEYVCFFESNEIDMKHRGSIFVHGFDCSFPMEDIKSTLIKHLSSCGKVTEVCVPYDCKTGSPMGFAFINMDEYPEKALALNGSYLGGLKLQVTMAIDRDEYYGFTNHRGCQRCGKALGIRIQKNLYKDRMFRIPLDIIARSFSKTEPSKQDGEANSE